MKFQPNLIPRFNLDYTFSDFIHGLKSIFSNKNLDLSNLKAFSKCKVFFTNSGRTSLYIILRSLNLPKGSKIGVPLYSCTAVFDAIIKAGYIPSFIDIDFSNYTLDSQHLENKINDVSAVIVIHTFGRPTDMDNIKKIANGLPVIEDCAHSMLSEYKGEKTGTIGTASFFSLGKYISAGGGGMIILNDDKFENNFKKEIDLLNSPTMLSEIKHSLFVYIFSFLYHKPWFGSFAFHIGSAIDKKVDITDKNVFEATKIKKNDLNTFLKKIERFSEKVELQRKNTQILLDELQNTDLILPYERKGTKCNFFLFPILFSNKEKRDNAFVYLRNLDIDTAKLYTLTPTVAKQFYRYKGDCPNTEKFADRVLTIPNYYSLNDKELLNISNAIKKIEGLI